jgi:hypothetical protein
MALTDNLQAFYRLSDTSDSSGNNRTLTNNGNVSFAPGKIGNAAVFDGSNYLSSTGNAVLGTSDFSVAGWVNATNLDGSQKMYYVGGSNGFTISLMDGILHTANANVADLYDFNSSDITNNSWFHLLVKRSGAIFTAYVNGQSIGTYDSGDTIEFTGDSQFIGAYIGGGYNLEGQIDSVGIWNRALSDAEVAALYNNGTGLELPAGPAVKNGWIDGIYWINDVATTLDQSGNGTWVGKLYENGSLFSGTKYELTFVDGVAQPVNITTEIGADVPVSFGLNDQSQPIVKLVFASITSAGQTTVEQIVPTALPASIPAKYTVAQTLLAYSIDTTATFSGTINVDFILPANISESVFTWCKAYHIKNDGTSEELTRVSSDFATRKITVAITSFSDFLFLAEPNLPPNYKGEWDNYTYYGQDDVVSVNGQYWILSGLAGWTVGGAPGLGYGWTKYGTSLVRISGGSKFYGRVKFGV